MAEAGWPRRDCPEDLIAGYALGALETDELELVERHLAVCARCREAAREARRTAQLLAFLPPPQPVPARARRALLARIRTAGSPGSLGFWLRRPAWLVATAATVLALLFGWQLLQQQETADRQARQAVQADAQRRAVVQLIAQRDGLLIRLQGTGAARDAHGAIILDPSSNTALVAVEGLPRPAPGQAYVVWLVRGEEYRQAGLLPVDERGHAELFLSPREPLRTFDALAITLENSAQATAPSGQPVALATLD
ncbi:MAG: anti-sigma factor [Thermomicrobium sp.]|nr:anti-sigma factor [Thermomicrobium sp.]MDW8060535.1 anti-sigma factor [Thermomicrobium sp.]